MEKVHVENLKLVYNALVQAESWESLEEAVKQSVRVRLDGVTDPESAMKLALEIQAIGTVFHTLKTLCETK